MDTPEPNKNDPYDCDCDNNLNDIIAQIKKENEELLAQLEKQKAINAELTSNVTTDFKSVQSIQEDLDIDSIFSYKINNLKNGTTTTSSPTSNGKSLNEIVLSQDKMIKELTNQLKIIQTKSNKRIKELEVYIYIKIRNIIKKYMLNVMKKLKFLCSVPIY